MFDLPTKQRFKQVISDTNFECKYILVTDNPFFAEWLYIGDKHISVFVSDTASENNFSVDEFCEFISVISSETLNVKYFHYFVVCSKKTTDNIYEALDSRFCKYSRNAWKTFSKEFNQDVKELENTFKILIDRTEGRIQAPSKKHEPKGNFTLDDIGNAQRFDSKYGELIRYSTEAKGWFIYDSTRWIYDKAMEAQKAAIQVIDLLESERNIYLKNQPDGCDLVKADEIFNKFIKTSRSSNGINNMLNVVKSNNVLNPSEMDLNKDVINIRSGLLNLRNGKVTLHNPNDNISKITNFDYIFGTKCPTWISFLNTIFDGNSELIHFIKKALGYSLTGDTRHHCIFYCYGTGRNGKSTFLNIISHLMGDYAATAQASTFMQKTLSGSGTSELARLRGARFLVVPEPGETMRFDEGLIKQITGGDKITASLKYQNEIEFIPEFKMWMPANYKLNIRGTDDGMWRRIFMIPFSVQIPENEIDFSLSNKLKQESRGIAAWLVDGCRLWRKEGLQQPNIVKESTLEYREEMDIIGNFLRECTEDTNDRSSAGTLYKTYRKWANDNGEYEMGNKAFGMKMSQRYEKIHTMNGKVYIGLKIKAQYMPFN